MRWTRAARPAASACTRIGRSRPPAPSRPRRPSRTAGSWVRRWPRPARRSTGFETTSSGAGPRPRRSSARRPAPTPPPTGSSSSRTSPASVRRSGIRTHVARGPACAWATDALISRGRSSNRRRSRSAMSRSRCSTPERAWKPCGSAAARRAASCGTGSRRTSPGSRSRFRTSSRRRSSARPSWPRRESALTATCRPRSVP
jgi:hypothetical protein